MELSAPWADSIEIIYLKTAKIISMDETNGR